MTIENSKFESKANKVVKRATNSSCIPKKRRKDSPTIKFVGTKEGLDKLLEVKEEDSDFTHLSDEQLNEYMSDGIVDSPIINSLEEAIDPSLAASIRDAKKANMIRAWQQMEMEERLLGNKDEIIESITETPNPVVASVDPIKFADWQKKLAVVTDDMLDNQPANMFKREIDPMQDPMQEAKVFFRGNRNSVQKQCEDVVALYSVKQKKPFYFITPAEARIAIECIKNQRNKTRSSEERDHRLHELADITTTVIFPKIMALTETEKREACYDSPIEFKHNNTLFHYIGKLNDPFHDDCMTLNGINHMFMQVEQHDLTVTSIFMHAKRLKDIRNFGRTVYDESTKSELEDCSYLFGRLFTANLYRFNVLAPPSVLFVSNDFVDTSDEKAHISFVREYELIDTPDPRFS